VRGDPVLHVLAGPEAKVREGHARLWPLVAQAIGIVDEALVYDISDVRCPLRLVASFFDGRLVGAARWPAWLPAELVAAT
jgi:predicted ABC-type ATPase